MLTPEYFNENDAKGLPGLLGIRITEIGENTAKAEMGITDQHLAINGYLHAGTVITLADTTAGSACMAHLPESAIGFTTIELKSNFMSTAREGRILCQANGLHLGKTTQVWEAVVTSELTKRVMAKFTCTQFVLYPR